jgi:glycosyltransferase involved in cell wall biosynthesis
VLAISAPLARKVKQQYRRQGPVDVLENGVRRDLFHPRDRRSARDRLGLPHDATLVGTAGALSASRDIATLLRAADIVAARDPHVHLVVAGPRDRDLPWPKVARVHDLGVLDHDKVPDLFASLDVMVTTNANSAFGAYCHPQKLLEAAACGVAVVAAVTGSMAERLEGEPDSLYRVGDAEDLARTLSARLAHAAPSQLKVQGWDDIAQRLSAVL